MVMNSTKDNIELIENLIEKLANNYVDTSLFTKIGTLEDCDLTANEVVSLSLSDKEQFTSALSQTLREYGRPAHNVENIAICTFSLQRRKNEDKALSQFIYTL